MTERNSRLLGSELKKEYDKYLEAINKKSTYDCAKFFELYALDILKRNFPHEYDNLTWNEKGDNYDFTSEYNELAIEVTSVMPKSSVELIKYERNPKVKGEKRLNIDSGLIDANNRMIGVRDSLAAIKYIFTERFDKKVERAIRREAKGIKYNRYELVVIIRDCPFYDDIYTFRETIKLIQGRVEVFARVYIISADALYYYDFCDGTDEIIVDYAKYTG